MSASCCNHEPKFDGQDTNYKRVLWIVIAINFIMFLVEMISGLQAQSQALKADSLDFLGDSLTYLISVLVIGKSITARSNAALFKGVSLAVLGVSVFGYTLYRYIYPGNPDGEIMGAIGFMALAANGISAFLLLRYRSGDANVRSVWLCTRNDAIGNMLVMGAAIDIYYTGWPWPDLIVATVMALLFLSASYQILSQARHERQLQSS